MRGLRRKDWSGVLKGNGLGVEVKYNGRETNEVWGMACSG